MQYPDYKPDLESPPLSDEELRSLDDLLAGLPAEQAMNIEQLDGFLTALLLAPKPASTLAGADWIPTVWGGDGPGEAPFASGKQKKRAIVLVLRHLHALDRQIHHQPDAWEPVFSVAETADGDELADAEDWCIGFLQATTLDPEGWSRLFDDAALGPLLVPIGLLGGDESQLPPGEAERLADPVHRDALTRSLPDAVLALAGRPRP
jgi:uncharacterized protein